MTVKPAFNPLLATKLYHPPPRPDLVLRPRLLERLDAGLYQADGFTRKLTLISASAGYGKTTLIAAWLNKKDDGEVAWLLLDDSDNDPRRFITYLIAAMQQIDASIGKATADMLQAPQPPPNEVLLSVLINEIAVVPNPFILVLDDYHVICTPLIHQQLAFLIDHQPANLHLVMTTRQDPLLPISRLRARGQVLEIRQEDLRFTTAEAGEFLQRVMGLAINSDEIHALERRTEGWIAGLQLAALSMQGRHDLSDFIQAFTGSSRFILDYLIEEVFEQQSPDVKDFLLKTSILERLSGSLCNALTEKTNGQKLLEILEQANLFIVPLDQSRVWYRYHRLFAELLRHRLRTSDLNECELHQQASLWFEKNGLMNDAIQHALDAQAWERAGSLIQSVNTDFLKRGEVLTLIGWFQSLPEEILLSNPQLCFDYIWPLLLASQYDLADPLLEHVEQAAKDIPAFLGDVYAAQAYLARGVGDHERMVERSQQALALLPKSSLNSRCIVALNLGLAYWHMGEMHEAERILADALEAAQATDNHYAALTALIFLGRVFAVRGQLHQAAKHFESAIQQGKEIPVNALAYMDLATLHYEWNALDLSDLYLQKAITLCQRSKNDEFLAGCRLLALRLRIAQGDLAAAEETLRQAWNLVRAGNISAPMIERVTAAQAYLSIEKGESTEEWNQKLTEKADCHPFYRFLGVTKARTLPDTHARAYLEGLSQAAQANEWGYGLVAIRALQASFAENQDDGLEYLHGVLQLAEGGRFIRSFVEAGEKLIPLLRAAAEHSISPDYVAQILTAIMGDDDTVKNAPISLLEPLSERELDVLQLLAMGMSNREIAEKLVVSTGTAKTHVHNLCGKLGVRNRTEAAMKAKELGLV